MVNVLKFFGPGHSIILIVIEAAGEKDFLK